MCTLLYILSSVQVKPTNLIWFRRRSFLIWLIPFCNSTFSEIIIFAFIPIHTQACTSTSFWHSFYIFILFTFVTLQIILLRHTNSYKYSKNLYMGKPTRKSFYCSKLQLFVYQAVFLGKIFICKFHCTSIKMGKGFVENWE